MPFSSRPRAFRAGLFLFCAALALRANAEPDGVRSAEAHYRAGLAALEAGQPRTAAEEFERALMENPDHAGAWYDYGLTLCRLGERASCRALLAAALARFGPPPALAGQGARLDWVFNGEARAGLGHSSNLTRGVASSDVRLFIDGQELRLPLASEFRPQSAAYREAGADLRLRHPLSGFEAGLTAYRRDASDEALPSLEAFAVDAGWDLRPGERAGLLVYRVGEHAGAASPAIGATGAWYERAPTPGQPRLAFALERRQTQNPEYRYGVARIEAGQRLSDWGGWPGVELQGAAETETKSERPGGAQRRLALVVRAPLNYDWGRLDLSVRGQHAWDTDIYSPLFGNVRRRLDLYEGNVRASWPLGQQIALRAEFRATRQRSNLELFGYSERAVSLGVAYRW
jgi:tetratricopeptide (TPR) repeat protein